MTMPSLPLAGPTPAAAIPQSRPATRAGLGDAPRAAVRPNYAFFLMHHRDAWQVSATLEQPVFLPTLSTFVLQPGVNGVRTMQAGMTYEDTYRAAIQRFQQRGYVFLDAYDAVPSDCLPPGAAPGGYLRMLDARHPLTGVEGTHYHEAWSLPEWAPDDRVAWSHHRQSYERWLSHLVRAGAVAPMGERIGQQIVRTLDERVERAMTLSLSPDLRERVVKERQARLAMATAARDGSLPALPETPKTAAKGAK
jgi:hypothetical protein